MKKWIGWGTVGVVILVVLFGDKAWTHVRVAHSVVSERAQKALPLEMGLRSAEELQKDLSGRVHDGVEVFTRQQLRVEKLEKLVKEDEDNDTVSSLKREISTLSRAVGEEGPDLAANEALLAARLAEAKSVIALQTGRRNALEQTRAALESTRQKLTVLRAHQKRLAAETDRIRSRLEVARANDLPTGDIVNFGASVEEVDAVLKRIEGRLNFADRTTENARIFIPEETGSGTAASGQALLSEVDEFLNKE